MKYSSKIFLILYILGSSCLLIGSWSSEKGRVIISSPYETQGQRHWFVTPNGSGDCSGWDHACTFNYALTKCTDAVQDVIWLGEGLHDTDNGVDGNGATISVDGVTIVGVGSPWAANSVLMNSDGAAAIVLKVTGDGFNIRLVDFDNSAQTDVNVTYLQISGSTQGSITDCRFIQPASAASGIGILLDSNTTQYHFENIVFEQIEDYGISTNGATKLHGEHLHFEGDGIGLSIAGANDNNFCFRHLYFTELTTGISITGANVDNIGFCDVKISKTTNSIIPGGVWNGTFWQDIEVDDRAIKVYPTTDGTSIDTGDGAWVWTASPTTIIPADTITKPFYVTAINVPTYDATQTYKIELFYGESTANISMGIYQFTVGVAGPGLVTWVFLHQVAKVAIPANSIVGAKLMSSTAGTDNITVNLSYEEL